MTSIVIDELIDQIDKYILIDVRSPSEYEKGKIPTAINIPLLNDAERKEIGRLYKQVSKKAAIRRGLDFFGPKMRNIVESVDVLVKGDKQEEDSIKDIALYCWRGGMRSNTIAWLLGIYGYNVVVLQGGYKSYRNWCAGQFTQENKFVLIGGYTGSGKTKFLESLTLKKNLPIINIEEIANHKGSAFGGIGLGGQPSQEMFENDFAYHLYISRKRYGYIVIEDESQRIGLVSIPQALWENMKRGRMIFLNVTFNDRLNHIIREYAILDRSLLGAAIVRLQKKLGGLETKNCLEHLLNKDFTSCFTILLKYYDKLYLKSLENKRTNLSSIEELEILGSHNDNVQKIYNNIKNLQWI